MVADTTVDDSVEDQATDYRKKAIAEIDALEDATEDPSIDILGTIPSTMKLSTMMTGKSPIITLKKLLDSFHELTNINNILEAEDDGLKYLKLNNFYNFRQAETDATTLDYDTRQMIFNTIQ